MLKIRFWPALTIAFVMAVTIALGFWQLSRAHQKEARQHAIVAFENAPAMRLDATAGASTPIEYHRVLLHGHFLTERPVYLDNRPYQDQPGFYLLMPFALEGGGTVLVNRGWLPRNPMDRTAIAPYATPTGTIDIEGVVHADVGRTFALGNAAAEIGQKIRQNLDVKAYSVESGLTLMPFVVVQTSDTGDRLVRDWPRPADGVERNYGYMLQWWGMALAALCFGLFAARKAAKSEETRGDAQPKQQRKQQRNQ